MLSVEVPPEEMKRAEEAFLAEARAQIKVPGFRTGKAPTHLVLRHYGEEEFASDLKKDLIRRWLSRALAELDLHPVTTPTVETSTFIRGERLSFRVKFAVLPEVTIPGTLALDIPEPPPAQVTDEELQGVLSGLRRDAAVLEPKEGAAEEGDTVRLERGDRTWEGEATASRPIGRQLLGVRAGQRVTLTDEEGHAEGFAVTGVYRTILPTPDEAAAHYGHPSWDAFSRAVEERVRRIAEVRRVQAWRLAALDAVADALKVEVPPTLLAEAVADELRDLRLRPEQKTSVEEGVRRKLRREIVAQRIAEAKGLLPGDDEVRRRAEEEGREESAVRAALVLERAADWAIAHARRKE